MRRVGSSQLRGHVVPCAGEGGRQPEEPFAAQVIRDDRADGGVHGLDGLLGVGVEGGLKLSLDCSIQSRTRAQLPQRTLSWRSTPAA